MPLSVGSKAPTFTLKTINKIGLYDWIFPEKLECPLVILFFPAAFSQLCTEQFCNTQFHGLKTLKGTEVIGISNDSPFALEAWKEENNIEIILLSDRQLKVTQLYNVLLDDVLDLGPFAARAAFVIDTEGVIRYSEQTDSPFLHIPDFNAIRNCIKTLLE